MSCVYVAYKLADKQLPCGTPSLIGRGTDNASLTTVLVEKTGDDSCQCWRQWGIQKVVEKATVPHPIKGLLHIQKHCYRVPSAGLPGCQIFQHSY
ncbi:hypothetical protein EVAR_75861_1 [Eumeta japonica]|uniref:Uncharacterized protein n=1 Tax=Eumeta variegata TaxID=151549 RepID=A0A4C1TGM0_EUMVA|nr:hypothetical protein EVAR_75861_1 [Eumeta japonica]